MAFRNDTPEEHVRQRVARSLVEEYGYDRADLHIEFPVKMGSGKKKRVDIAIFPPGSEHKQELIFIIVEAKREDVRKVRRNRSVWNLLISSPLAPVCDTSLRDVMTTYTSMATWGKKKLSSSY